MNCIRLPKAPERVKQLIFFRIQLPLLIFNKPTRIFHKRYPISHQYMHIVYLKSIYLFQTNLIMASTAEVTFWQHKRSRRVTCTSMLDG